MVEGVRGHFSTEGVVPSGFFYEKFALAAAPAAEAPVAETAESDEPALAAVGVAGETLLVLAGEGRAMGGQVVLPEADLAPLRSPAPSGLPDRVRHLAGQEVFGAALPPGETGRLDDADDLMVSDRSGHDASSPHSVRGGRPAPDQDGRAVAGQEMFPLGAVEPLAAPAPVPVAPVVPADERPATAVGTGGYQIGEEHPSVHESDALFDARCALELGATELVVGRLSSQQVTGYRLLAEATVPYVDGDRFVDAAAYTETNAAFHDYLFTLTGNEHLTQAYHALGVKGHMEQSLRTATWCHPRCTQDHLDIVDAFEAGDRDRARQLIREHADRSKETTRRAMADNAAKRRPRFISPGRFDRKVVVVTGAAQGIGRAVAERAAVEGGQVVLLDRSPLVREVADELLADGVKALALEVDLEDYGAAAAALREAQQWHGRIDVLVNNVGGAINFKPFTEFTDAEIAAEINRSLLPTLWCCRAVLPGMVERGGGVIVNVSSAATRGVHRIPYSAAKGGVNALTASLAFEYADAGIRVVATAPGGTEAPPRRISRGTPMARTDQERVWFQAHVDQTLGSSLLGRYGTLDEQAAAILFLASDEASYITGAILPVSGGDPG